MSTELENIQPDTLSFIHITDTHLLDHAEESFYGFNTKKYFEKVLSHSLGHFPNADFLLVTGDISQTGTESSYKQLKSVIDQIDIPIYCVPGNHDQPKNLQLIIPSCPDDSINIIQFGNYELVLISSWVKNVHHGIISQQDLVQLEDYLTSNKTPFVIIAVHHPPAVINSKWLDKLGLQNREELLYVINKYPGNAMLLCGHIHQELDVQLQNLRLLGTPSTCYQFKKNSEIMSVERTQLPGYRFVSLHNSEVVDSAIHYVK